MSGFPDGALDSNYSLCAGTVITEIRRRPFYSREKEGWDYTPETVHFQILEVGKHEYRCQYLDWEDNDWFYWSFWTEQPHYGFWIDQCSQVRYYTDLDLTKLLQSMSPSELAVAATYIRTGWKNIFTKELCRRAGLQQKYEDAHTNDEARLVTQTAAKSFGFKMI